MPSCFFFPHLQQGFSFSFFFPWPVVKHLPRHDVWPSLSREAKGFIGRVKTKPLICLGLSKVEARPVSPDSRTDYVNAYVCACMWMCMCRVRDVSGGCSLLNISFGKWFQTCGAAWVRLAGRLFQTELINTHVKPFTKKKTLKVITTLMCSCWGKGQTLYS